MDVKAVTKYARVSPDKARDLARAMRGTSVLEALRIVQFSGRKAATLIEKTLKSAIGNAENNAELQVDSLRVKEVIIEMGPSFQRFQPVARGSAHPILKKTCHIHVVLTDENGENAA